MDENTKQSTENLGPPPLTPVDGIDTENMGTADADAPRAPFTVPVTKKSKKPFYIILAIIFVATVAFGVYFSLHLLQKSVVSSSAKTTTTTASSKKTVESVTPVSSQDAAIDTNLNDIDSTLTQASTDQSKADAAMSDSDQQITVPTE